jgi:tetratricopeptide (TPR) repeat protein
MAHDFGGWSRPVSAVPAAQAAFDEGLALTFGFNHAAAIAAFGRAAAADPGCGMAHWGIAYAAGPNYNLPWDLYDDAGRAAALARAFDATQAARAAGGRTPADRALIAALSARYPQRDPGPDMAAWDRAFADAMEAAHLAHPGDLDIRAVYAESLLTLTPWKMWDLASGAPTGPHTLRARSVLERAFAEDPRAWDHPGLLHLYVHLMEMSPTPEAALPQADRLRVLAPGLGHLVHMATHIDVLCGAWADALAWNLAAVKADEAEAEANGRLTFYTGYRLHNYHFACYAAMFLGRYAPARDAALGIAATVPEAFLRIESPPMADYFESYFGFLPHVHVRFGRWDEAIAAPLPADPDLYRVGTAMAQYAKAVAHAALGRVGEARRAEAAFHAAAARVPPSRLLHNNRCVDLLGIAAAMIAGEIAYREGRFAVAFDHLREAVRREDSLPYDEPWGWMQPVRHALGALLLEQGEVAEAEAVYRADLGLGGAVSRAHVHPDNVWALRGLLSCLEARGERVEAVHVRARLALAAARADPGIAVSCLCARGAPPSGRSSAARSIRAAPQPAVAPNARPAANAPPNDTAM